MTVLNLVWFVFALLILKKKMFMTLSYKNAQGFQKQIKKLFLLVVFHYTAYDAYSFFWVFSMPTVLT